MLVGEYPTKSNATRSDLIDPFLSAAVHAWSPSSVRSRIATSVVLRLVDIDHAGGKLLALALLVRRTLFAFCNHVGGVLPAYNDDAVVIRDDRIARHHIDAGANHGHVDRAER